MLALRSYNERTSTERRMLRPDSVRSASAALRSSAMMPSAADREPGRGHQLLGVGQAARVAGGRDHRETGRGGIDGAEVQGALQAAQPLAHVGDVLERTTADEHDGIGLVDDRHRR